MHGAHPFTIRRARESDDRTLAWLASLPGQRAVRRPALIGDIDGIPAAAISLLDGSVVADPFRPDTGLPTHLRLHRSGWRAHGRQDAARQQLRAVIAFLA